MSKFNEQDLAKYQEEMAKNQENRQNRSFGPSVGFFSLKEGEEALVRFNISSVNDLTYALVHKPIYGSKFDGLTNVYAGVDCLNTLGSTENVCPFCTAAANNDPVIERAKKKVYLEMLVAKIDSATGSVSQAEPMIWERPSGFKKEIETLIKDYGNLKNSILKYTRVGTGSDTRYIASYAMPNVYSPDLVPVDFSAFDNFKIERHSYYEKSAADMSEFVSTRSFPKREPAQAKTATPSTNTAQVAQQPVAQQPVAQPQPTYTTVVENVVPNTVAQPQVAPAPSFMHAEANPFGQQTTVQPAQAYPNPQYTVPNQTTTPTQATNTASAPEGPKRNFSWNFN